MAIQEVDTDRVTQHIATLSAIKDMATDMRVTPVKEVLPQVLDLDGASKLAQRRPDQHLAPVVAAAETVETWATPSTPAQEGVVVDLVALAVVSDTTRGHLSIGRMSLHSFLL